MPIKNILSVLFCAVLCGCSAGFSAARRGGDVYPGLSALRAANIEGRDYSREVYDRGSPVTVFAIHGGDIELMTARLARRIADKDFNLYIFNGWLGPGSGRLHITATRFDDPDAVRLATSSVLGISVHAQAERGAWVCVGGGNAAAARLAAKRLEEAGFAAQSPCPRLPGVSGGNIVNLPSAGGVQLEITLRLLERLARNGEDLSEFTRVLRMAALEYLTNPGGRLSK